MKEITINELDKIKNDSKSITGTYNILTPSSNTSDVYG